MQATQDRLLRHLPIAVALKLVVRPGCGGPSCGTNGSASMSMSMSIVPLPISQRLPTVDGRNRLLPPPRMFHRAKRGFDWNDPRQRR